MLYIKLFYSEKGRKQLVKKFLCNKINKKIPLFTEWITRGIYVREVNQKTRINLYHIHPCLFVWGQ